jgi:hypothetical protein
MHQHREPCGGFDERPDGRSLETDEEVTFRCPGTARSSASGTFADEHVVGDVAPRLLTGPGPRHSQRPSRPETRDQLTLQRASALHVEGLVDRLVADPHGLIIGEVDLQPPRDLLGAPALHPPTITAMRLVAPRPRRPGRAEGSTGTVSNASDEPVLDVRVEPLVRGQLPLASGAGPDARHAIARSTPGSPPSKSAWRSCGGAPSRSSTGSVPNGERSPGRRDPEHARPRCPHVP